MSQTFGKSYMSCFTRNGLCTERGRECRTWLRCQVFTTKLYFLLFSSFKTLQVKTWLLNCTIKSFYLEGGLVLRIPVRFRVIHKSTVFPSTQNVFTAQVKRSVRPDCTFSMLFSVHMFIVDITSNVNVLVFSSWFIIILLITCEISYAYANCLISKYTKIYMQLLISKTFWRAQVHAPHWFGHLIMFVLNETRY